MSFCASGAYWTGRTTHRLRVAAGENFIVWWAWPCTMVYTLRNEPLYWSSSFSAHFYSSQRIEETISFKFLLQKIFPMNIYSIFYNYASETKRTKTHDFYFVFQWSHLRTYFESLVFVIIYYLFNILWLTPGNCASEMHQDKPLDWWE